MGCGCGGKKSNTTAQAAAQASASRSLVTVQTPDGKTQRYSSRERAEAAVAKSGGRIVN